MFYLIIFYNIDLSHLIFQIITKDSNVIVVATAGKCLAGLAGGLKKRFQPYAGACVPALLEKFREKKQNVVVSLRDALDAIFPAVSLNIHMANCFSILLDVLKYIYLFQTNVEAILEDVTEALNNKNPSVKAETASFLTRSFGRTQPTALNKKILKAYTTVLLKTLNEPGNKTIILRKMSTM